ncbi:general odorant-binding protein 72-like [Periplaneta americana]|uniref:general odorant-binding protein 72-like n=1 Tax=Periplaneta americana TaxID=6978 RepID=UPI0037E8881B
MTPNVILSITMVILAIALKETSGALTPDQLKKAIGMIRKACQPKSGVSTDLIDAVNAGDFQDDRKLKCYMRCVLGMGQGMSSKGKLTYDVALAYGKKMLPSDMLQKLTVAMEKCRHIGEEFAQLDACDLAFEFMKCMYNADPELFQLP